MCDERGAFCIDSLLGLPLERALAALADRGIAPVEVVRSIAPRRAEHIEAGGGLWRVVRVRSAETVSLDVCCFERTVE